MRFATSLNGQWQTKSNEWTHFQLANKLTLDDCEFKERQLRWFPLDE